MQKKILVSFICSLFFPPLIAQPPQFFKMVKENTHAVSLGLHIPLGEFSETHFGGITAEYSSARRWSGKVSINPRKFRFSYNGGVAYYFGKEETVSGYDYKYPGYFFIHGFVGLLYVPGKVSSKRKIDIKLTAGPALGIYNGNTAFNMGAKFEGTYFVTHNIAIGPGIMLMKETKTDAIWSAFLKVSRLF